MSYKVLVACDIQETSGEHPEWHFSRGYKRDTGSEMGCHHCASQNIYENKSEVKKE